MRSSFSFHDEGAWFSKHGVTGVPHACLEVIIIRVGVESVALLLCQTQIARLVQTLTSIARTCVSDARSCMRCGQGVSALKQTHLRRTDIRHVPRPALSTAHCARNCK